MHTREVMQLALAALEMELEFPNTGPAKYAMGCAIKELRAELAKPEPEPAGWFAEKDGNDFVKHGYEQFADQHANEEWVVPLYRKEDV